MIAWIVGIAVALVGLVLAGLVLFTTWTARQVEKRLPPRVFHATNRGFGDDQRPGAHDQSFLSGAWARAATRRRAFAGRSDRVGAGIEPPQAGRRFGAAGAGDPPAGPCAAAV
jgi:hypothetical protein